MELDNFLQEWHPNYSGSNEILQIDLLEQYMGLLDDECRTRATMEQSDIDWIERLDMFLIHELYNRKKQVFDESIQFFEDSLIKKPQVKS